MEQEKKSYSLFKVTLISCATLFGLFIIGVAGVAIYFYFNPVAILPKVYEGIQSQSGESFDHPLLSEEQESLLSSFGVDVSALPTELSEEQINCAVSALGQERVNELMQGSAPTIADLFKAQSCF